MATCSVGGAPNVGLFNFHSSSEYYNSKFRSIPLLSMPMTMACSSSRVKHLRLGGRHGPAHRHANPSVAACSVSGKDIADDVSLEDNMYKGQNIPGSLEVQSLLTTICDTTSVVEFELKLAGFRVYVKRGLVEKSIPQPVLASPQIQSNTSNVAPYLNGSADVTSLAISRPKPLSRGTQNIIDTASDEGLVILQSPKVGFFRTSRTIKGKRAPPSCKEKQEVKEGQVLCFIEQLGGEIPIESDVSGEIIKILRRDGEPVGYGDALLTILPSFPGIKKLQ
ncbi:uncharacterized protein M6B38_104630 [Iris pallida]|uniref:Lipoyl-binding domain-containing protein n=1 Tax=Iris pallida TaxID=29817 RepID=A0AAX6F3W3_IRIPA|nr:uncharacterized protein M6B38_104630 [Iris pallida]